MLRAVIFRITNLTAPLRNMPHGSVVACNTLSMVRIVAKLAETIAADATVTATILIVEARFVIFNRAERRPSQGFASVFCFYFWCSEFPARLQSLNSD